MTPLFGYGTFRRTAWRVAILGADYPAQPATLRGYRRIACASGYLSLRETLFDVALVHGVLIELDELGWRIADRWEEVPKYLRTPVVVNSMHGPIDAITYICADDAGASPVDEDCFAIISDAEVEASIETFGPRMRALRRALGA
ncbi:MAG TPA: gamma-glutamylcyclotransferase family protein [Candidatus Elarobacter sp.]|nr:gamma-glutamylcyclotransferase family protein [Candidatus Elarobacter sp.]